MNSARSSETRARQDCTCTDNGLSQHEELILFELCSRIDPKWSERIPAEKASEQYHGIGCATRRGGKCNCAAENGDVQA